MLTEKQLAEYEKLTKQLSNPQFVAKAPSDAVTKARARVEELQTLKLKPPVMERTGWIDTECISHVTYQWRTTHPIPSHEDIILTYHFTGEAPAGVETSIQLGYFPSVEAAKKTLSRVDAIFYPAYPKLRVPGEIFDPSE